MGIGCLAVGLLFILCTFSSPVYGLAGDQGADKSNHLLIQREAGAQDVLSSVQEEVSDIFDLNLLPNGTEIINSATEYFAGTLGAYYSIPRSVIDTIRPGPLPYELFLPTLSDVLDGFLSGGEVQESPAVKRQVGGLDVQPDIQGDIQTIATNYVMWLVPVLVVAVLSLVLAVCFPCIGCCFCCCRLCGYCGGKAYHYRSKHQTAKCFILSIIILLSSVFLLVGIILGFLSNNKISSAVDTYTSAIDAAIQDGVNFIDNTLDEVTFIATDQLDNVLDSVTNDIDDVSTILGNSLETALERESRPFQNSTNALFNHLADLQNGFQDINTKLGTLSSVVSQLNSSVLELQEALNNISTLCMGNPSCLSLIPQSQQIMLDFNENEINVSDALSTLDSVDIGGIQELVDNATQVFSNISGLLEEELGDFDLPINRSQFESVTSVITSARDTVDGVIGSNGTISEIRDTILGDGDYYIGLFNTYRYGLAVALFVTILLIWIVYLTGLFCSVFGYSSKALPYERSHVSNCGARLLLFGTALSFISGGLLLILASFMYFASTGMQKICDDFAPSEYTAFQRIFDDQQVWDGRTLVGSILHSQLGIDSNISITTFFRECESNSPLYQALQVDSFLDVDELISNFTNITDQLDFGDIDFGSVLNLSSSDFFPVATRQNLEDLQGDIMNSVNFTAYKDYLNENPLAFDLQEVFDNLTVLATHFSDNMMDSVANYTIEVRNNLVGTTINMTYQEFIETRNFLVGNLTDLSSDSQDIGVLVDAVFDDLDRFLNESGAIINNEVEAYIDRILGYITGFIDFAVNAIKNEVGRCRPFTAAYTGLHITFCSETLDGLNGFWFSVGWCVAFLIPILISGAILTNYIRRSPSDVHSITDTDDIGYDDTVISNTRIANYSNQHDVEMTRLPNTPHMRASYW